MPDDPARTPSLPGTWGDAFAALPADLPPPNGWQRVSATLDARRRTRTPVWLATAAAVLLAIALPWKLQWSQPDQAQPGTAPQARAIAPADPLEPLYAESAQLESLLAVARDDTFSSGTGAVLASELESRLAGIDATLRQPDLSREQRQALWQERVDSLRALTTYESNRRWLAAQGSTYDAALAVVD